MAKNIIICCDGTGNEYGLNNTNVVHAFEFLVRDSEQVAFYDPGVGTFDALGRVMGKKLGVLLGQAFGYGLRQNIEDAYLYLMNNYQPPDPVHGIEGDKVFLFGFSRGAFTARATAGMLFRLGLLQRGSENLIPYASKLYNGRQRINPGDFAKVIRRKEAHNEENRLISEGFRRTYCNPCEPFFIGVWDTVGSLGYFYGKQFFDDTLHPDVSYGYHAISLDEKRKKFPVSLWNERDLPPRQTIEQVWFAGVHSDVGGWYEERGLSDAALKWMLTRARAAGMRLHAGWDTDLKPAPERPEAQHESRESFWRMWRPVDRQVPDGALVHQSVVDRIAAVPSYRPVNLPQRYTVVPWD